MIKTFEHIVAKGIKKALKYTKAFGKTETGKDIKEKYMPETEEQRLKRILEINKVSGMKEIYRSSFYDELEKISLQITSVHS